MKTETVIIHNHHSIPAVFTCPDTIKGAVVMLHGTGSNKNEANNSYETAAKLFADFGIASIRFDFQGFGDSTEDSLNYHFRSAVSDTVAVRNYLSERLPGTKICVLGWSQGGTMALLSAALHPELFDGVIGWAAAVDLKMLLDEEKITQSKDQGYFTMNFDWREPVNFSEEWVNDVLNYDILEEIKHYPKPILAIACKNDTIVDPKSAEQIVKASSHPLSRAWLLEDVDHIFNVFAESRKNSLKRAIQLSADFILKI